MKGWLVTVYIYFLISVLKSIGKKMIVIVNDDDALLLSVSSRKAFIAVSNKT